MSSVSQAYQPPPESDAARISAAIGESSAASDSSVKDGSLRKRMLKTFGAHTLGNLVTLADRFLLLPIMLWVWGPKLTGIWLTIRAIPAVLSVGELGFANATGNSMTQLAARNEMPKAASVYWATARLINTISVVCLLLTLLATLSLPLADWFIKQGIATWEFNVAVWLMALYTVSIFQTQLVYAGYRTIHQQAFSTLAIHLVRVAELLLVMAALCFRPTVLTVAAGYVVARLLGAWWLHVNLMRRATWLREHRVTTWSEVRPLVKPAMGFAAMPLAQTFQLQGSTWAVAAATTPEIVAAFTAMRTLARFPIQFCASLGRTAWPELSQSLARKDLSTTTRLYSRMMWLSLLMAVAAVVGLLWLGPTVYGFWTSARLEFAPLTFAWLAVAAGLNAISSNSMTLLNAQSQHGRASLLWVAVAVSSVVICGAIHSWLGVSGISAVLLAGEVLVLVYVFYANRQLLLTLQRALTRDEQPA